MVAMEGRFGEELGVRGEVKGVFASDGDKRPKLHIVREYSAVGGCRLCVCRQLGDRALGIHGLLTLPSDA